MLPQIAHHLYQIFSPQKKPSADMDPAYNDFIFLTSLTVNILELKGRERMKVGLRSKRKKRQSSSLSGVYNAILKKPRSSALTVDVNFLQNEWQLPFDMCRKHNESVIISCYEFGLGNMLSQSYNEFAKLVDSGYNSVIVDVVDTTAFNNAIETINCDDCEGSLLLNGNVGESTDEVLHACDKAITIDGNGLASEKCKDRECVHVKQVNDFVTFFSLVGTEENNSDDEDGIVCDDDDAEEEECDDEDDGSTVMTKVFDKERSAGLSTGARNSSTSSSCGEVQMFCTASQCSIDSSATDLHQECAFFEKDLRSFEETGEDEMFFDATGLPKSVNKLTKLREIAERNVRPNLMLLLALAACVFLLFNLYCEPPTLLGRMYRLKPNFYFSYR